MICFFEKEVIRIHMIKNFLIALLLCLMHNAVMISMDIDYDYFFQLCQKSNQLAVREFVDEYPMMDINYKEKLHGETPLLYAAGYHNVDIVSYLLKQPNIDKMAQNNYKQTLWSKIILCWSDDEALPLLNIYTDEEINTLCRLIKSDTNWNYKHDYIQKNIFSNEFAQAVLKGEIAINSQGGSLQQFTLLHNACLFGHTPLAVQLIERGASLHKKDVDNRTPGFYLIQSNPNRVSNPKITLFTIREAFNNIAIPITLVCEVLVANIDSDAVNLVKQFYTKLMLSENFFNGPKAHVWKKVCVEACKKAQLLKEGELKDERCCLAKVMFLSQAQLTQVNKQLALEALLFNQIIFS